MWSKRLYIRLSPGDIAMFKFLLEGYDHTAYVSAVDKQSAVLQMVYTQGMERQALRFLEDTHSVLNFDVLEIAELQLLGGDQPG